MNNKHLITVLPDIEQQRKNNMKQYSIMMTVRMLCLLTCFIVPITWVWVPALAAVFLPIIATMSTTQNINKNLTETGNIKNQLPPASTSL